MRSRPIDNFICLGTFPCMWSDCKASYNFKAANAIIELELGNQRHTLWYIAG